MPIPIPLPSPEDDLDDLYFEYVSNRNQPTLMDRVDVLLHEKLPHLFGTSVHFVNIRTKQDAAQMAQAIAELDPFQRAKLKEQFSRIISTVYPIDSKELTQSARAGKP